MKKIIILFTIIISMNILFAQTQTNKTFSLSHPLKSNVENNSFPNKFISAADTFKIVAILVQYQEDNDGRTSGNGKFDLSNKYYNSSLQRDTVIDSPPYDSAYFADHLLFLKNYFYKSSKGKLILKYDLFGKVITLSKQMQQYSPQRNENNLKLGEMFKESWAAADSMINFSSYDPTKTAFVIFHAGVGRDIDLTSLYGYDPTPYDLPSVYMGIKSLKELYGNNYNGYQTSEGFTINNSLIIPSTELRDLDISGQKILLQLGMNGILTGSFGSYLGLPDLFNTKSGKTSIGRFGLMDGQSIFSYNGIFPPEPSAWEKIFLGWIQPTTISSGDQYISLKSSSTPEFKDSTIVKVLINSREYFLIENRNRNPFNLGQKIYTRNRSFIDSTLYTKDVEGFINYDIYGVNGNLIDVSYLDWSLPGAISDTSNYRGGILIWHIDENIIDQNFSSNTVNNDIEHKGIDLEEAKGSQDIGVTFNTPFGAVTGDGYFVDFWYNGNHYVPANIYKNQFTPSSYPNTLSYSLSNNNIYITEFDSIKYQMKFRIKIGSDVLSPITGYPKFIGGNIIDENSQVIPIDINNDSKEELFVNNGNAVFGFANNGSGLFSQNGLLINGYGSYPASYGFFNYRNENRLILSQNSNTNSSLGFFKIDNNFTTDTTVSLNYKISTTPLIIDSNKVVLGFDNGFIYQRSLVNNQGNFIDTMSKGAISKFTKETLTTYKYSTSPNLNIICGNFLGTNSLDSLRQNSPTEISINNKIINNGYNVTYKNIIAADINKDGKQEFIFTNDNKVYAVNSAGILLDNFPFKSNYKITSGISICDINDDGIFDLVFLNEIGDIYALGTNGKLVDGFPYRLGYKTFSTPAFYNYSDSLAICILSSDGYLYSVKTNKLFKPQNILWKNYLKDKNFSNNNFKINTAPNNYSEKLPKDKVYNWPNPVYDTKTYIRYYLNGNCSGVNVKILDLSGELVTKLNGTTNSNMENEIEWNVSNVQSGLYYGVIEATIDNTTETKIIKIAIVK